MAKTKLEKLDSSITSAITLRDGAIVGDQQGQHTQAADILTAAIETAQGVAGTENIEDAQLDAAFKAISEAVKSFNGSASDRGENGQANTSLKGVVLYGTPSQKQGVHTIFAYGMNITFRDGNANVNEDLAQKLISDGYAEEGTVEDGE